MAKKKTTKRRKKSFDAETQKQFNTFASRARNYSRATGKQINARNLFKEWQKQIRKGYEQTRLVRNVLATPATHAHRKGEKISETKSVVSRVTLQIADAFAEARSKSAYVDNILKQLESGQITPLQANAKLRDWSHAYHKTKLNDRREFYSRDDF